MPRPERLGPYRIDEPLGKGGMGHVYAATHDETGQRVAIKALSPELAMAEGFRERFEAEIESLRLLRHPSIVQLYGYGEDGGTLFYAMEIVDGASLDEELRAGRRFNWREVTRIAIQVSKALKHAHDHGVIHRDIKPANILLDRQENAKLADFGIARLFGSTQLTSAGGVLGTADYMSPEQADGRPVTSRCDQYSLGCVMYALLAGRPPFRAKSLPEMLQLQRYAEPEPVRRYAPRTPAPLERVIAQLLEKSPEERFPNTMVLARHLEAMTLALSRPGRDDFHVNEDDDEDTSDDHDGDADNMAMTQADPSYEAAPSVSLPGVATSASTPREEVTRLAPVSADDDADDSAEGDRSRPPRPSFTVVGEDVAGGQGGWLSTVGPLAMLLLLVAVVAGVGFMVLQPPGADRLYQSIQQTPESAWEEGDTEAQKLIDEFIRRFPNDPRAEELKPRLAQLDDARLERRLRAASLLGDRPDDPLSHAEQLYVAALRLERVDPAAAAQRLEELASLLALPAANESHDETHDGPQHTQLAALARRQLTRLKQQAEAEAERLRPFAESRLAAAKQAAATSPDEAAQVCRGLIATYGYQPWAEAIIEEARALLDSLED